MTKKITGQVLKWVDSDLDTKLLPVFLVLQLLVLIYLVK